MQKALSVWFVVAAMVLMSGSLFAAETPQPPAPQPEMLLVHLQWVPADNSYTVQRVETADAQPPRVRLPKSYTPQHHWVVRITDAKGNVTFEEILKAQPFIRVPPANPDAQGAVEPSKVPAHTSTLIIRLPGTLASDATLRLYQRKPGTPKAVSNQNFEKAYQPVFDESIKNLKQLIKK